MAKKTSQKDELTRAREAEQRALADYQNLLRRTREDQSRMAKFATRALVSDLLQPLEHLSMAAEQLNDAGLNMVVEQLWAQLKENGLEEIETMGQEFDVETMEVVEANGVSDKKQKVVKVHRRGYRLNGEVIQHAKVVLG